MAVTPFVFVVLALASFRLTRLTVVDTVWEATRGRMLVALDSKGPTGAKAAEMLSCSWCAGWWVSVAVYAAYTVAVGGVHETPLLVHLLTAFAVAGAQGLLSALD